MTRNLSVALFLAFALSLAASAQTAVLHSKGAYAQTSSSSLYLLVINGNSFTGPPAIDYSTFTANPDGSYTYGYGYGNIPRAAFVANNLQRVSLNLDTSQVAGFQAMTCTVVYQPVYSQTCSPGPFGVIQITWQQNGQSSTKTNSNSNIVNGPFKTHIVRDETDSSANSSGTFLGTTVLDYGAEVGLDHGSEIDITTP